MEWYTSIEEKEKIESKIKYCKNLINKKPCNKPFLPPPNNPDIIFCYNCRGLLTKRRTIYNSVSNKLG